MATQTSKLNLRKPEENDYYNEQLEQSKNWDKVDEAVSNDTGAVVGHNGIKYIQDVGEKVASKLYYDKLQSGLWYCKVTNSDVVNTSNFEDWSNYKNGKNFSELGTSLVQRGYIYTSETMEVGAQEFLKITFPIPFKTPPVVVASISTLSNADPINPNHVADEETVHVYIATKTTCMVKWVLKKQSTYNGRKINWIAVGEK